MSQEFEPDPVKIEDLPVQVQENAIRLPVRVGMYVSMSDKSGGQRADKAERDALIHIITAFAQDYCKTEFVQTLMNATLARQEQWEGWAEKLEIVPEECTELISNLNTGITSKDRSALIHHLYDIGQAVALAYREDDQVKGLLSGFSLKWRRFRYRAHEKTLNIRPLEWSEFLNISAKEQQALERLGHALEF